MIIFRYQKVLCTYQKNSSESSLDHVAIQRGFVQACTLIAEIAVRSGCFSRVPLRHLACRTARERFPQLGSQFVSNVIYAVCRKAEDSATRRCKDLMFDAVSTVLFDGHTLSVKQSTLSMLTLGGRMKFQVSLSPQFLQRFKNGPLKEVQLIREDDQFFLLFCFKQEATNETPLEELEQVI